MSVSSQPEFDANQLSKQNKHPVNLALTNHQYYHSSLPHCHCGCAEEMASSSSSSSSLALHSIVIGSESDSPSADMDPIPNHYPILSYVFSHLNPTTSSADPPQPLLAQFPHLNHTTVFSALAQSLPPEITQIHSLLRSLGPRPDPSAVAAARSRVSQLNQSGMKEEIEIYMAVVRLEELHEAYERQLRDAEERMLGVYRSIVAELETEGEVNEEVVAILKEAETGTVDRVDLSGRQLRFLPEAFGKLHGLVLLNLSQNQLEVIPDSIAGLQKLEELDVSSNLLKSLPDSIGLLLNLRVLNVSGNKLNALPESITRCCSLVELDASFNYLTCLPTNIGYGLVNLERLSIYLNKIHTLPQSICEMRSLRFLDAHFNEIHGLPSAIGRLTNLEILNLSSNFSDFTEVPETISDLTNLMELDLSNNQIRSLPDTFFRLEKLMKLNLEQNPLIMPPMEIVNKGVEAVREFMAKRWADIIEEEQKRSMLEANKQPTAQTGWLAWGTSLLNNVASGVSQSVAGYLGGEKKTPTDSYLDQQL